MTTSVLPTALGQLIPTTANFLTAAQWVGILTLACGAIAALGFVFKWGIRFRLVGAAGFMAVLTVGLFGLGLVPFVRTSVPGAVPYTTIYDAGANEVVIAVRNPITEAALTATLQQAAGNLFSPGRLNRDDGQLLIRARTMLHPEPGISQPLYLGQVRRSLSGRDDENMEITLFRENLAKLPKPVEAG